MYRYCTSCTVTARLFIIKLELCFSAGPRNSHTFNPYVTVLVFSVKHNYYNFLVFLFVHLATCFGHLSSGYLIR
jgi:hypothetical protein